MRRCCQLCLSALVLGGAYFLTPVGSAPTPTATAPTATKATSSTSRAAPSAAVSLTKPRTSATSSASTGSELTSWPLSKALIWTVPTTTTAVPSAPTASPPPAAPSTYWGDYAADALSTDTTDWACIRTWESGDTYTDYSGAYGFEGADYSWMPPSQQDALALRIFQRNGDRFAGAWNDKCTEAMGLE